MSCDVRLYDKVWWVCQDVGTRRGSVEFVDPPDDAGHVCARIQEEGMPRCMGIPLRRVPLHHLHKQDEGFTAGMRVRRHGDTSYSKGWAGVLAPDADQGQKVVVHWENGAPDDERRAQFEPHELVRWQDHADWEHFGEDARCGPLTSHAAIIRAREWGDEAHRLGVLPLDPMRRALSNAITQACPWITVQWQRAIHLHPNDVPMQTRVANLAEMRAPDEHACIGVVSDARWATRVSGVLCVLYRDRHGVFWINRRWQDNWTWSSDDPQVVVSELMRYTKETYCA